MRKNQLILAMLFALLLTFGKNISAQEPTNLVPGPVVKEEQKLMVTIRLEITDGDTIRTENQYGFALYPQTVITELSPALIFGARATIIYQDQVIPSIKALFNNRAELAALLLIKPLLTETRTASFFSKNDFGKIMFMLTPKSIINSNDITEEDIKENHLRGAVAVDDYGKLLGIVSGVKKYGFGALIPQMIQFDTIKLFIEFLEEGPPIPRLNFPEGLKPAEAAVKPI